MNNSALKQENIGSVEPSNIQIEFDDMAHHLNKLSEIVEHLYNKLEPIGMPSERCKTMTPEERNHSHFASKLFKFNQDLILNIDTLSFMYDNLDI